MTQKPNDQRPSSLFECIISRPRPWWLTALLGVVLLLAPLAALALDGLIIEAVREGYWHILLVPPVLILYIVSVAPPLERMGARVTDAFRSLTRLDAPAFDELVRQASRVSPVGEMLALALGTAFGLWLGVAGTSGDDGVWTSIYMIVGWAAMFGLLAWTIFNAVAGTRLTAALHRQPLDFDILHPEVFEPMGRHSLATTLVFIGGILLSLILGLTPGGVLEWQTWALYGFLTLVALLVFFLNMLPTHRVLAAEKQRELDAVAERIVGACRSLLAGGEADGGSVSVAERAALGAEASALVAYEQRITAARTWPYNTRMLRTLFVALVLPGLAEAASFAFERFVQVP